MKRFYTALLCFFLLITTVSATGDPNIGIGGGGLGGGSSQNLWYGDEGVRVTIVDIDTMQPITSSIDIMREPFYLDKWNNGNLRHFGKVCKLEYRNGASLIPYPGNYVCFSDKQHPMPKIIKTNSQSANVQAIRSYFTDEQVLRGICDLNGFNYNSLIDSNYRVMIEPVAHFLYHGLPYAMTATEAALYNIQTNGDLRACMAPLTHQNLPLAIYLEKADMGYPAWAGSKTGKVNDDQIISSLGVGLVRFTELPQEPPVITAADYEYRVDTDVITAVTVSSGQSDPDNPVNVEFLIDGTVYTASNIYYPRGSSQLAWVRWHTPSTPKELTIRVTVSGPGSAKGSLKANIEDLAGNEPPNPLADDRNDEFTSATLPIKAEKSSATWGVWRPWWHAYWVWVGGLFGHWEDRGWWEFDLDTYTASITSTMRLLPDEKSPTATGSTMKSGYGVTEKVGARVQTTQSSATTEAQTAVSYFPEFGYSTYWRLLERTQAGYNAEFEFAKNRYSTYNNRTHFTPVWYPDGEYKVFSYVMDAWTPAGMLSSNLSDEVEIRGSLWDDWHIAPSR